ncbi:spermatogenesis-associated protein 46 [Phyllostomus discolor]|uniref:Spermatogenesis-associated protein 46 n=1 Tax=Phyllostomus discolor TaxID=89673 RepID=A0A7E6CY01_9CHIR|nr:spermatogenesis-associated protein 46 [Phyllostomus discolor]
MERFSLLSISGPRASCSALTALPGLQAPRATSLPGELWGRASPGLRPSAALPGPTPDARGPPGDAAHLGTNRAGPGRGPECQGPCGCDSSCWGWEGLRSGKPAPGPVLEGARQAFQHVAKPTSPTEVPSPVRAPPPPPHTSSALRHGVVLSPGCADSCPDCQAAGDRLPPPAWWAGAGTAEGNKGHVHDPGAAGPQPAAPVRRLPALRARGPAPPGRPAGPSGALSSADCVLGEPPDGARPRRSCTIYRPWFSPYSYFVCLDKESRPEAPGLPELPREEGRGDGRPPEDAADSACSSASSPDDTCPREAAASPRPGPDAADHITPQDLLRASRGPRAPQSGFQCAACCRMYPTLRSLRGHVRGGSREGFSCRVFYRKLKALWARPADRLSSPLGGCQAHK